MYFIKCMVTQNKKWNGKEWEQVEEFLNHPCGTEYSIIIRDLKTLRGVKNRIKNYHFNSDIKELHIYSCYNIFDDNSFKLLEIIKR